MAKFIKVDIPVTPLVRDYIVGFYTEGIALSRNDMIGSKLLDLLGRDRHLSVVGLSDKKYCCKVHFFVTEAVFNAFGVALDSAAVISFNKFVEYLIKDKFLFMMEMFISNGKRIETAIDYCRDLLNIGMDSWGDDGMKKFYYRYRKSLSNAV